MHRACKEGGPALWQLLVWLGCVCNPACLRSHARACPVVARRAASPAPHQHLLHDAQHGATMTIEDGATGAQVAGHSLQRALGLLKGLVSSPGPSDVEHNHPRLRPLASSCALPAPLSPVLPVLPPPPRLGNGNTSYNITPTPVLDMEHVSVRGWLGWWWWGWGVAGGGGVGLCADPDAVQCRSVAMCSRPGVVAACLPTGTSWSSSRIAAAAAAAVGSSSMVGGVCGASASALQVQSMPLRPLRRPCLGRSPTLLLAAGTAAP